MASCSFTQCFSFFLRQANAELVQSTGVDALGKLNDARYQAGQVGIHTSDPVYAAANAVGRINPLNRNNGLFTGHRDPNKPNPKFTPKERLATTVDEFIAMRDRIAKTPHGGAVCFMHAFINWANPATRHIGAQMLVLAIAEDLLVAGNTYKTYALNQDIASSLEGYAETAGFIAPSYVVGTTVQNGYMVDPSSTVSFAYEPRNEEGDDTKDGIYTVYFWSTGDPNYARGVTIKLNPKGFWKVTEFGSLLSEVQKPWVNANAAHDL